jgi:hypothetical protein
MSEIQDVRVTLASRAVRAGGTLTGSLVVTSSIPVSGLELSVLWLTSGTGIADEGVVHFEALDAVESGHAVPIEVHVPLSPTSWEGEYVRVGWLVRVRHGDGPTWDTPFTVRP